MDLDVDFSEHVEGIREGLAAFVDHADHAGLDTAVPSAPGWTVRDLVAHQGMVHRWATATLTGATVDPAAVEAEGRTSADPVSWLHEGGLTLVRTLEQAPEDLEAPVFLPTALSPRRFWARRQCHETTIHSVDAHAARLGRLPTAAETWVTRHLALDGIDELLVGFLSRRRSPLRSESPLRIAIQPTDVERSWLVHVSTEPPVVERDAHGRADHHFRATAETLYLALWNRNEELDADGYDLWRRTAQISWT